MTQDVHVKLNLGFPWQKEYSPRVKTLFTSKLDLNARKKLVKCYIWSIALYGAETWILGKVYNTWKILKCGAGEGWRRSVGPIVWEMKYYIVKKRGLCY